MNSLSSVVTGVATVLAALATSGACSSGADNQNPGAGGSTGAGGSGGGMVACTPTGGTGAPSTAVPGPNFQTVQDIASNRCGGTICHSGATNPRINDNPNLYATLTTYRAGACGGFKLVEPCKPDESAFYLAQMGQCDGIPRMPLDCVDTCTPEGTLEAVRQWIANGAQP
jgi:hypothetical protein